MMSYLVDRDAVGRAFDRLVSRGERVCEAGRLTLDPTYRGSDRHLAAHIIEGAIGFFFFLGIENAFIDMVSSKARFYGRYGFREIEGTATRYQPVIGDDVTCLHGTLGGVPSPQRERLVSMGKRIARYGIACRCATYPACLTDAYETGDFRDTDGFCPMRAKELLAAH
jgi:hypothetical protein